MHFGKKHKSEEEMRQAEYDKAIKDKQMIIAEEFFPIQLCPVCRSFTLTNATNHTGEPEWDYLIWGYCTHCKKYYAFSYEDGKLIFEKTLNL